MFAIDDASQRMPCAKRVAATGPISRFPHQKNPLHIQSAHVRETNLDLCI